MTALQQIELQLKSGTNAIELGRLVKKLVDAGVPRPVILQELERLRMDASIQADESLEDVILEIMDLLVGWCAPPAKF